MNNFWQLFLSSSIKLPYITVLLGLKEKIDYDGRSDGQEVYHGFAPVGAKDEDKVWIIVKYHYNGPNWQDEKNIAYDCKWTERKDIAFV